MSGKMTKFKDLLVDTPNRYTVNGEVKTIVFSPNTITQEGTKDKAEYFNEMQKNGLYNVNATRVVEGTVEFYDIAIEGSDTFDVFDTQFIINFNETNTKLNPVLRFNGNNYYIRALNGFVDIDVQIGSLQKTYIGFLDSTNNKLKLMNYERKLTFDTVAESQTATWLVEGDIIQYLGYYSKNDGACHYRKIENSDDGSGIAVGDLFANLIIENDEINVLSAGLKQDGTYDTSKLKEISDFAILNKYALYFPKPKVNYQFINVTWSWAGSTVLNIEKNINKYTEGTYVFNGSDRYIADYKRIKYKTIWVHPTIIATDFYTDLESAINNISDNSFYRRYTIRIYGGYTYTLQAPVVLKDFVSFLGIPSASGLNPVITSNFGTGYYGTRDMFKTTSENDAYSGVVVDFPIRCSFENIKLQSTNINYCFHADFNMNPDIEIKFKSCFIENLGGVGTGYAVGIGQYGNQKISFENCEVRGWQGVASNAESDVAGIAWHSRNFDQNKDKINGLHFLIKNSIIKGSRYGLRMFTYESKNINNIVELVGCNFTGLYGDILWGLNTGVTKAWDNVIATGCNIKHVNYCDGDTYQNNRAIVQQGYSKIFNENFSGFSKGDIVIYSNAYGGTIQKATSDTDYKTFVGVVIGQDETGKVVVQTNGIAIAKQLENIGFGSKLKTGYDATNGVGFRVTTGDGVAYSMQTKKLTDVYYPVSNGWTRIFVPAGNILVNLD